MIDQSTTFTGLVGGPVLGLWEMADSPWVCLDGVSFYMPETKCLKLGDGSIEFSFPNSDETLGVII